MMRSIALGMLALALLLGCGAEEEANDVTQVAAPPPSDAPAETLPGDALDDAEVCDQLYDEGAVNDIGWLEPTDVISNVAVETEAFESVRECHVEYGSYLERASVAVWQMKDQGLQAYVENQQADWIDESEDRRVAASVLEGAGSFRIIENNVVIQASAGSETIPGEDLRGAAERLARAALARVS